MHPKTIALLCVAVALGPLIAPARAAEPERGQTQQEAHAAFVRKMSSEKGAVVYGPGQLYIPLRLGAGEAPTDQSEVTFHYRGTLKDGTEFLNTYKSTSVFFVLSKFNRPCLKEGLKRMKAGGKAKLICPADVNWPDQGVRPGMTVVWEVELLEVHTGGGEDGDFFDIY